MIQKKDTSKSDLLDSYMSNRRSKSANDITRYGVNARKHIIEKINWNEDSISILKSSEIWIVSKTVTIHFKFILKFNWIKKWVILKFKSNFSLINNFNDDKSDIEWRISRFAYQESIIDESSESSKYRSYSADNSSFSDFVKNQKK